MSFNKSIISGCIISLIISSLIGYKIVELSNYVKGIGLGIVFFMGGFVYWMELLYFLSNKKYKSKKQKRIMFGVIFSLITIYSIPIVLADIAWELEWMSFPIRLILLVLGNIGLFTALSIFVISDFKD